MKNPLETQNAGKRLSTSAIVLLSLAVLPHVNHLHYSILLSFGLMVLLKLLAIYRYPLLGNRWIILVAAVLFFSNSSWHYGIPVGRDPGVSFLIVLLGLKLMESRTRRDARIVLILGYFVVVTHFLFFVSAPVILFLFVIVAAITWLIIQLGHVEPDRHLRSDVSLTGKMIVQAIPFALILFFLFPRFGGALWLLQSPSDSGVTGMSDTMSMGSIASLVESSDVAFTATFDDGNLPPNWARYWRAGVLWFSDGRNWIKGPKLGQSEGKAEARGGSYYYEIDIPTTRGNWMYALDIPTRVPGQTSLSPDLVLSGITAGKPLIRYTVESSLLYRNKIISPQQKQRGAELLPGIVTRRIERLIDQFRDALGAKASDATAFSNMIFRHFNELPFSYTLRPALLTSNAPVDEFLFETREGFCEYYAASYATLMRAAGFPARIVIGYLGGEYNPRANQLTIRQSDAHAWAEYWSESDGWIRADPTAAIAPERIQSPINYDLSMSADGNVRYMPLQLEFLEILLRETRWYSALAKQQWDRWFVGFDQNRQRLLLQSLGMEKFSLHTVAVTGFLVSLAVLVSIVIVFIRRDVNDVERSVRLYTQFCKKMARNGVTRENWEGPEDFCNKCVSEFPNLAGEIYRITRIYTSIRYYSNKEENRINQLEIEINSLAFAAK